MGHYFLTHSISYKILRSVSAMVFISDGCSFYYAHIQSKHFDLLKAFDYIVIVVTSKKKSENNYVTSYVSNMFWATILYKYHVSAPLKEVYFL